MEESADTPQDRSFRMAVWFVGTGLGCALFAFLLAKADVLPALRWGLFLIGVLAAAGGVNWKPKSAIILTLAGFASFLASLSLIDPESKYYQWDSLIIFLRILTALAWLSAVVVMLPSVLQRAVVSLVVVFHFVGIGCAATSAPPVAPWMSLFLLTHVYHNYLHFLYLTNAYQFYAPEPGPASYMWFFIEYESDDDQRYTRWVKVPYLDEKNLPRRPDGSLVWPQVEHYRRLAMPEGIYAASQVPQDPHVLSEILRDRHQAVSTYDIPFLPGVPEALQYAPPGEAGLVRLKVYLQHVANTYRHPERPELPVKSIKYYRAVHQLIQPAAVANGWSPSDPTLIAPFYFGEFDRNGDPLPYYKPDLQGRLKQARDPFQYWLIPIIRLNSKGEVVHLTSKWSPDEKYEIIDYVDQHARIEVPRP